MGMLLNRRRASVGAAPVSVEPTIGALLDENLSLRQENAAAQDELAALKATQVAEPEAESDASAKRKKG